MVQPGETTGEVESAGGMLRKKKLSKLERLLTTMPEDRQHVIRSLCTSDAKVHAELLLGFPNPDVVQSAINRSVVVIVQDIPVEECSVKADGGGWTWAVDTVALFDGEGGSKTDCYLFKEEMHPSMYVVLLHLVSRKPPFGNLRRWLSTCMGILIWASRWMRATELRVTTSCACPCSCPRSSFTLRCSCVCSCFCPCFCETVSTCCACVLTLRWRH